MTQDVVRLVTVYTCLKSVCALLPLGGDRVKSLQTWLVPSAVDSLSSADLCSLIVLITDRCRSLQL